MIIFFLFVRSNSYRYLNDICLDLAYCILSVETFDLKQTQHEKIEQNKQKKETDGSEQEQKKTNQ